MSFDGIAFGKFWHVATVAGLEGLQKEGITTGTHMTVSESVARFVVGPEWPYPRRLPREFVWIEDHWLGIDPREKSPSERQLELAMFWGKELVAWAELHRISTTFEEATAVMVQMIASGLDGDPNSGPNGSIREWPDLGLRLIVERLDGNPLTVVMKELMAELEVLRAAVKPTSVDLLGGVRDAMAEFDGLRAAVDPPLGADFYDFAFRQLSDGRTLSSAIANYVAARAERERDVAVAHAAELAAAAKEALEWWDSGVMNGKVLGRLRAAVDSQEGE